MPRKKPSQASMGDSSQQGRAWIVIRYILPGAVLGAAVGLWAAKNRTVLSEEVTVLTAAAGADVAILSLTLAAMTFVIALLEDFFGELMRQWGIRNFFFPFVLVSLVSAVGALFCFAGVLDHGIGAKSVQDAVFGAATFLTVWSITGAVGLVLVLVSYTDERALLLGIPKKYPRVDGGAPANTEPSASATGPPAPTVSEPAASPPVARPRGLWYRIVARLKRRAGRFGTH